MVRCLFGAVVSPKAGRNGQDMTTGSRLAVQPLATTAALLAFYFLDGYIKGVLQAGLSYVVEHFADTLPVAHKIIGNRALINSVTNVVARSCCAD
jgi:hypothetical protein